MIIQEISNDTAQRQSVEEIRAALAASPNGLPSGEVRNRLAQFGPNALEEKG